MNADIRIRFFREVALNLRHEGFTVKLETEDGLLPVELDNQPLCQVTEIGGVRYRKENVDGDSRSAALDKVIDIAKTTAEYMRQLEAASRLTASGLTGGYRLLAKFNDTVLAGHPTKYGVQFVTWEWGRDHTALYQGHYYSPGGVDSYASVKRDFAVRSGLVPRGALFAPEQLTEVCRCIHETLEASYPLTDERRSLLESAAEQIESGVPDLEMSNQKKAELAAMESPQNGGMQFY